MAGSNSPITRFFQPWRGSGSGSGTTTSTSGGGVGPGGQMTTGGGSGTTTPDLRGLLDRRNRVHPLRSKLLQPCPKPDPRQRARAGQARSSTGHGWLQRRIPRPFRPPSGGRSQGPSRPSALRKNKALEEEYQRVTANRAATKPDAKRLSRSSFLRNRSRPPSRYVRRKGTAKARRLTSLVLRRSLVLGC